MQSETTDQTKFIDHTDKSASGLPDQKVIQKCVSFAKRKLVNI